jgi:hypothetical protein
MRSGAETLDLGFVRGGSCVGVVVLQMIGM